MKRPLVIGIVGTAKNTGKTTTLNALLAEASRLALPVAVTSIGYDGEEIDSITLLPKPRIVLFRGMLVSTSERCLVSGEINAEVLQRTGIVTALGEILILRMKSDGVMVVAGPNKRHDLQNLIAMMERYEPSLIFADGALNRIAPMSAADRVIFTTGGSRSEDIDRLSEEMSAIESFFRLPVLPVSSSGQATPSVIRSLMDPDDVGELLARTFGLSDTIEVSGLLSLQALEQLAARLGLFRYPFRSLVFRDPFVLLMNDHPIRVRKAVKTIEQNGISVSLRHSPGLSCITVNPFVPFYQGNVYVPRYLNAAILQKKLSESCITPVLDAVHCPPSELFQRCVL